MKEIAFIFLGSGIGGALRYSVGLLFAWALPTSCFPLSTITVNVVGSFLMGTLFALPYNSAVLYLGLIGFCGGFTTFSALSGEGMAMLRLGQMWFFAGYAALSVVLGVSAACCGFLLASK